MLLLYNFRQREIVFRMLDVGKNYCTASSTLRTETFAGIKFRVFWSFSRKFLPLKIINHQNAKVFSREITNIFQTRQFFWQVTNSCSIFLREHELYTEFVKVFPQNL